MFRTYITRFQKPYFFDSNVSYGKILSKCASVTLLQNELCYHIMFIWTSKFGLVFSRKETVVKFYRTFDNSHSDKLCFMSEEQIFATCFEQETIKITASRVHSDLKKSSRQYCGISVLAYNICDSSQKIIISQTLVN